VLSHAAEGLAAFGVTSRGRMERSTDRSRDASLPSVAAGRSGRHRLRSWPKAAGSAADAAGNSVDASGVLTDVLAATEARATQPASMLLRAGGAAELTSMLTASSPAADADVAAPKAAGAERAGAEGVAGGGLLGRQKGDMAAPAGAGGNTSGRCWPGGGSRARCIGVSESASGNEPANGGVPGEKQPLLLLSELCDACEPPDVLGACVLAPMAVALAPPKEVGICIGIGDAAMRRRQTCCHRVDSSLLRSGLTRKAAAPARIASTTATGSASADVTAQGMQLSAGEDWFCVSLIGEITRPSR